jgi:hypothetical protein
MLRIELNIFWKDKINNEILCVKIIRLTVKIRKRKLSLAGHCVRLRGEKPKKAMATAS